MAIYWDNRTLGRPDNLPWNKGEPGTPIDTSKLAGRVDELRQHDYAAAAKTDDAFKKPLLVEEKRREMEKMAYFQKPPPEPEPHEPTEHEHGGGASFMFI